MGYGKELWIQAYEELVGEYLDDHPGATEEQAEAFAEGMAYSRSQDNLADRIDQHRKERREQE